MHTLLEQFPEDTRMHSGFIVVSEDDVLRVQIEDFESGEVAGDIPSTNS